MSLSTTNISVKELDCDAEASVLRRVLGSLPGIENGVGVNAEPVSVDIVNRRVRVVHDHEKTDANALLAAIRDAGMTPSLVDDGTAQSRTLRISEERSPWWQKHGLFIVSGILAAVCEGLYFAGVDESSWPIITMSLASMAMGGRETFINGWIALRSFTLNINFLMCVAVIGGAVIGAWPEIALVVFLFGLSELIEQKALDRARNAVKGLMELAPEVATVKQSNGDWVAVDAGTVLADSVILVKPGERVPLDGVVVAGQSAIDQAPITGESVPVEKSPGDTVFAGTINASGALEVRTTGGKDQTTLARIIRTVQEAQGSRAPTQRFVDRFSRIYTPVVCVAAVLVTFLPWLVFNQPLMLWLYKAMVLLVIACPCALVISTPVTVVSGLTAAARRGILIKGGVHLENGRRLKVIALDKTGTITQGAPRVTDVSPLAGANRDEILRIAASLDVLSQHPIAQAVVDAWDGKHDAVEGFLSHSGRGVEGTINGVQMFVGNRRMAQERGVLTPDLESVLGDLEAQGKTTVVVASNVRALGVIAVADTPRESSVEAIRQLHAIGIKTLMLSGDNQTTASAIAKTVGLDDAKGGMLPEDKRVEIERLRRENGEVVGMVGDGVNDAPALTQATIGFAMGVAGTDTALETADVALMRDDLRGIPEFINLSRRTGTILVQNISLAIGIKLVFFALAIAGLATMWMAVVADVGASLLVIANGLRLLKPVGDAVKSADANKKRLR